jgi:DNA-binding transcriptional ArsR family regulator
MAGDALKSTETSERTRRMRRIPGVAKAGRALDPVVHERVRLGVLSALAVASPMSFVELKESLELSDGNLSVHARKLEEAGYVACAKRFEGRVPRTEFSITDKGRDALTAYLEHMESIIRATRR